jgi:hypothetical protein
MHMNKKKTSQKIAPTKAIRVAVPDDLLSDLRSLIDHARDATARAVNSALVLLYWSIGDRIRRDILNGKRADYGKQIVGALSRQLEAEYGKGFTDDNLFRMIQLAEVFSNREIVGTLSRQLGWSHFLLLLPIKDDLKRDFFAEMCRVERRSPHLASLNARHALRAHRSLQKTYRLGQTGARQASLNQPALSRLGLARSLFPQLSRTQGHL